MTNNRSRIATLMQVSSAITVDEISEITGISTLEAQEILITMDDDGDVLMRNGFYRASELLKTKRIQQGK
jgi:hypothetical protein